VAPGGCDWGAEGEGGGQRLLLSGWLGDGCMRRVSLRVVLLLGLLLGNMLADLGSGIGMAIELHCMRMADCARAFDCILVVVR
jgi:hypothetical protein